MLFKNLNSVQLRLVKAEEFSKVHKPVDLLAIDLVESALRKRFTQSTTFISLYKLKDLMGKQVLVILNLSPIQFGQFMSQAPGCIC